MSEKLTEEEKKYIDELNDNIDRRRLMIQVKEWKNAFEKLAFYIRNHFCNCSLFDITEKIKELRPK